MHLLSTEPLRFRQPFRELRRLGFGGMGEARCGESVGGQRCLR